MMKTTPAALLLGLLAATSTQAAEPAVAKPGVVAFNASVRVEVDATGKPIKVNAPSGLPEKIRGLIEQRVGSWQYEPAKKDGVAAPVTTYVQVGACAIPTAAGDAFRLGLDYKGHGPGIRSSAGTIPPPSYPPTALMLGITGAFDVTLHVHPDGSVEAEAVKQSHGARTKDMREFKPHLQAWAKTLRYEPELLGGQPVATRLQVPVTFSLSNSTTQDAWEQERLAKLLERSECRIAKATPQRQLEPIALDSPVKVTPTPAG